MHDMWHYRMCVCGCGGGGIYQELCVCVCLAGVPATDAVYIH